MPESGYNKTCYFSFVTLVYRNNSENIYRAKMWSVVLVVPRVCQIVQFETMCKGLSYFDLPLTNAFNSYYL